MLLFADAFIQHLLLFRLCWIRGTLGGGKTLLAVALADYLLRIGLVDGVVANLPTDLPSSIGRDDGLLKRRAIIFDEAWTTVDARDSLVNDRSYGAYARKIESYWLFPSVHPVDKRLRPLIVERSGRIDLLNAWVYTWSLNLEYATGRDNGSGWFLLYNPSAYFGRFETHFVPVNDGGIAVRWERTMHVMTRGQGIEQGERIEKYLAALGQIGDYYGITTTEEQSVPV